MKSLLPPGCLHQIHLAQQHPCNKKREIIRRVAIRRHRKNREWASNEKQQLCASYQTVISREVVHLHIKLHSALAFGLLDSFCGAAMEEL